MAKDDFTVAIPIDNLNGIRDKLERAESLCRMLNLAMADEIANRSEVYEQTFHDVRNVVDTIKDALDCVHVDIDNFEVAARQGRKLKVVQG